MVEDGNEEDAAAELEKLLSNSRQPQQKAITQSDIDAAVKNQLRVNEATRVEEQLKATGEYDDVFNNQYAYKAASDHVSRLVRQGHTGSLESIMIEAMDAYREEVGYKPVKKETPAATQEDRAQRKRNMPKSVSSQGKAQRKQVQEQELTPEQQRKATFNKMRAARNQN